MSSRIYLYVRQHHLGLVAIFIALTGTAYAADKIGSNDIKAGAVKSKQIADDAVRSKDIRDETGVKSRDVKDESLSGADIDEDSLGTVPRAAAADSAEVAADADTVGGVSVAPFSFSLPPDTSGTVTVIERDGVRVTFKCGFGDIGLEAFPASNGTRVRLLRIPLKFDFTEEQFEARTAESAATNTPVVLADGQGGDADTAGSVSVLTASGRVTAIDYDARRGNEGQGIPCRFWGQIRSGQS